MKPEDIKEPTVEEALGEVQQLFPDELRPYLSAGWDATSGEFCVVIHHSNGQHSQGRTLTEAMAQVRKFHKEQS